MKKVFPYFKIREREDKFPSFKSSILKNREKAFSKLYYYSFLYPFIEVKKIKNSNDLSILKFDVWEESSLRESRIRHISFLIKKIFNPKEIYFVDIDKELVKTARRNIKEFGFKKTVIVNGDVRSLPFKDEKFDIVIDFSTTDHLPVNDFKKTIKEVYRVLKSDGIYLIYHLNSQYFNIEEWNKGYVKSSSIKKFKFPSFPRSCKNVIHILQKSNFTIQKTGFIYPFFFDSTLLIHWRFVKNKIFELIPINLCFSFFNLPSLNMFFYIISEKDNI